MKQVKLNLMAIIGMMVAVGTVAFTAPKEKIVFDPDPNAVTWYYTSNSMAASALDDPANYTTEKPSQQECNGTSILCSILDVESFSDPDQPAFSHEEVSLNELDYYPTYKNPL